MEEKYYTPTIEEFHVGFEYEYRQIDKWDKRVFEANDFSGSYAQPDALEVYIKEDRLRVKYLDEEDITSLGFQWGASCDNYSLYSSKDFIDAGVKRYLRITHYKEKNICQIETLESDRLGRYSAKFDGVIKNKSELKRVLNQIGYGR
jgi:hypothetical protein